MNSPSPKPLQELSDKELNKRIAGVNASAKRPSLSEVKAALSLDRYPEKIMEGGSREHAVHRFTLSERFLFLEVDQDDNVTKGFLAQIVSKPK